MIKAYGTDIPKKATTTLVTNIFLIQLTYHARFANMSTSNNPSCTPAGKNGTANPQGNGSASLNADSGNAYWSRQHKKNKNKKNKNKKEFLSDGIRLGFCGNVLNSPLENVVITHSMSTANQFKKLFKATRMYAAEKAYDKVPKIVKTLTPVDKVDSITVKAPNNTLWESYKEKEVKNLKKLSEKMTVKHWTVHNKTLKEILMKEYHNNREAERKEYKDCLKHQQAILNILLGQLCPTTVTNVKEANDYEQAKKDGDLVRLLEILCYLCVLDDKNGLTFQPLKVCKTTAALLGARQGVRSAAAFKEEIKVKYNSAHAMSNGFPLGFASLAWFVEGENKKLKEYFTMNNKDKQR